MKIGFDIDGVLADFVSAYQDMFIKTTGRNTFELDDNIDPPDWNWPTTRGYTAAETKAVWDAIRRDETFWLNLPPMKDNISALSAVLFDLEVRHEVYFITDRSGIDAKRQTKRWLMKNLGYHRIPGEPTVLLTAGGEKGHIARALKLDAYIDDRAENVDDVLSLSPKTRIYYPLRNYNADRPFVGAIRVSGTKGIADMLDAEIAKGNL